MPAKLQRRTAIEDEYMLMLWQRRNHRWSATNAPEKQSAFAYARALRQPAMPPVQSDNDKSPINLGAVWQALSYAVWWRCLIERRG
jgi:hypothetical protein